jgi:hypothetical protein
MTAHDQSIAPKNNPNKGGDNFGNFILYLYHNEEISRSVSDRLY